MVTDQQVRRLKMLIKKVKTKAIAAAKAGMDEKTARKYIKSDKLPSEMKAEHTWRTRKDPFEESWTEITKMLEINSGLEAKTIFKELQRKYPGKWSDGKLRTLQRKIKIWRATFGPAKEIFFPQKHYPGKLGAFDFTHMGELNITIQKKRFDHLISHFVLTYSNWETGRISFTESYESLSEGLQYSFWELGGVPEELRTDSLSAAVHKECNPQEFTDRYHGLLEHYDLTGKKTQPGKANENGDIEQRHNRFKKAVDQALMLRGSREFNSREDYETFLRKVFTQLNSGRLDKLKEEVKLLKPLPRTMLDTCKALEAKVGPSSTIRVLHNTYSVPSRLIGERVKIKAYAEYIEVWYAQQKTDSFPRVRGESKYKINYRHVIEWLVRKPGAFENYRYRDDLYPTSAFRMAHDQIKKGLPQRANAEYLKILHMAFLEGEDKTEMAIRQLLFAEQPIRAITVKEMVKSVDTEKSVPDIEVTAVNLSEYDELLQERQGEVLLNA